MPAITRVVAEMPAGGLWMAQASGGPDSFIVEGLSLKACGQ